MPAQNAERKDPPQVEGARRWARPLAWFVLVVGVAASTSIAGAWTQRNRDETASRLSESLGRASLAVEREMQRYEDLLRGVNSAFEGTPLSSVALARYLRAAQLEQRYPGAEAVALVERDRGGALTVRAVAPRGASLRGGAELASVPAVRTALHRSLVTGTATLSSPWPAGDERRRASALVLPFYARSTRGSAERRRALSGWLVARFAPGRFLDGALRGSGLARIAVTLEGPRPQLLAATRARAGATADGKAMTRAVRSRGQELTLVAQPLTGFGAGGSQPLLVLLFGYALSMLLAALVHALSRAEDRARRVANATVNALLEFEERFRSLAATPVGLFRADASGRITFVNERFGEIVGDSFPDARGLHWTELVDDRDGGSAQAAWERASSAGAEVDLEFTLGDGTRSRWLECRLAPLAGEGWVGSLEEVSERKRKQAELERRASRDPLTELPNRKHFLERLSRALVRAERRGDRLAVMFVDLDGFKEINDAHGHQAGDLVLLAVAGRLSGAMRESDTVARYGGDEFAILCERLEDAGEAAVAGRRIAAALQEPVTVDGGEVTVALSVGIAVGPGANATPKALLRAADDAMYRAKADGRTFELVDISPLDWAPAEAVTPVGEPDLMAAVGGGAADGPRRGTG